MSATGRDRTQTGFMQGIGIALLLSIVVSISLSAAAWVLPFDLLSYLLIFTSGLAYLLYLLSRSRYKTGRITVIAMYTAVSTLLVVAGTPVTWSLLAVLAMIWLVRSLYFYNSLLSALLDLVLSAFSIAAAIAAWLHTDSLFLSLWSLMLVQACFVWIPADWQKHDGHRDSTGSTSRFDVACRAAESAARKLATHSHS
jgi:hypothetical protein